MKVLLIGKSQENPSTRYRLEPLARELRSNGHDIRVFYEPGFLAQLSILIEARSVDLVFIQRKLLSVTMIKMLRARAKHLVFDFDDAVFLRSNGQVSETRRVKFDTVIKASDLAFAGNRYLADAVSAHRTSVELVPTCVELERYQHSAEKLPVFTLVWIGGRSTSRYLEFIRDDLEEIGKAVPGLKLRIIGDFDWSLENVAVECLPWSEQTEVNLLTECHVGIAPMKDDAWTKGKCALKVIQYMAAGLPVISSNVGANGEVIVEDETGFLVEDREGWSQAIQKLRESESLQSGMGQKAKAAAADQFSITKTYGKLSRRLEELVRAS